jgi:hypothetical protein
MGQAAHGLQEQPTAAGPGVTAGYRSAHPPPTVTETRAQTGLLQIPCRNSNRQTAH